MAKINQIGPGRKTTGTVDGIVYVTRKGVTYARATPTMPARIYNTPAALKRQAIFKMVQIHLKHHLRTIKQTFTPRGNGTPTNRYYSMNGKTLTQALDALADRMVAGEVISLADIEAAIAAYATEHPQSIVIASRSGYGEVFLTGNWPDTITLRANGGDSTIIVIVAENGTTTTINPDGTTVVVSDSDNPGNSSDGGGSTTITPPTINGTTPFTESTEVTMSTPSRSDIYYSTDGTTPTTSSTLYSDAFTLTATTTVKAIAVRLGQSSSVTTKIFTKSNG